MPTYPRLPDPPAPAPDDTAILYGCRILRWLLETDVYATCNAEQLRAAEHAAYVAVTAPGILPAAVDRVSAVRHAIAAQLRRLAQLATEGAPPACQLLGAPIGNRADDGPGNPGSGVPRRPYPATSPPAGSQVPLPVPVIQF